MFGLKQKHDPSYKLIQIASVGTLKSQEIKQFK